MVLALNVSALQLKDTHFITFLKNRIKVIESQQSVNDDAQKEAA